MRFPSLRRVAAWSLLVLASTAEIRAEEPTWIIDRSDGSELDLPALDESLPSPEDVLGYPLGERFSRHEEILVYLRELASRSERMTLWEYGRTYEDRPLVLVAISSASNIARLDELRTQQVTLANPEDVDGAALEAALANAPVCVWLTYGIHGNEASSSETAMAAAYVLAAARDRWPSELDEAIILIDPLANPDGRARFVHSFRSTRGKGADPYPGSAEHREPWPGGRQNHYLVDLNRDWAWVTQRETEARLREYRRWEPHVYVDFHEMSSRSSYFFPPSAQPIHPEIRSATVRWLRTFGTANAASFDRMGWSYYVGENFDLFYPGYSDSYPSLRGAIGMTYEMAGHGFAGLSVERPDGSLLTLADRIARHLRTTLTTVSTAIAHRQGITGDFVDGRRRSDREVGRTYIWRRDQAEAAAAVRLLEAHGLTVRRLTESRTLEVRPLTGGLIARERFAAGTYLLDTTQALGALADGLMAPETPMPAEFLATQRKRVEQNRSPEFFDITAWSLPLAFDLEAFLATGPVPGGEHDLARPGSVTGEGTFGYLIKPQGIAGYRIASALLSGGVRIRLALASFDRKEGRFPRGTLFVPTRGNEAGLDTELARLAELEGVDIHRIESGLSSSGISLGSDEVVPLRRPRIGLVAGPGVRATSFGFLWFLLDQELEIPHSRLDIASLDRIDLADFDVLILPDGRGYSSRIEEGAADRIERWLEDGGVLVAVGSSVSWLQAQDLTTIEEWKAPEADAESNPALTPERRALYTPGAAVRTVVHPTHPLTAGLGESVATLVRGRTILLPTGDPQKDLLVASAQDPVAAGFVWPEATDRLAGSLLMGIEPRKRGAVIALAHDPVFRLFWRATAPPFLNALLYAPSLRQYGQLFESDAAERE